MLQTTNSSIPELHTQKPIPENLSTFQQTPTTKSIIFVIGSHFTRLKLIFTKLCRTKENNFFEVYEKNFTFKYKRSDILIAYIYIRLQIKTTFGNLTSNTIVFRRCTS